MLKRISPETYKDVLRSKLRGSDLLRKYYPQCVHKLVSHWAKRVTPHQLVILMFVLDRTFYYGKLSETIVFDQFLDGMVSEDKDETLFSGLNMSKNTLLLHLNTLTEDDLLHARACLKPGSAKETRPRIYAINCSKLFNLDIANEEDPMILREPKPKRAVISDENGSEDTPRAARNLLKTPKNSAKKTPNFGPPNLGDIYTNNGITKVILVDEPAAVETGKKVVVEDVVAKLRVEREANRQQRMAERRPTRTKAAPKAGSMKDVQDQIDTLMRTYHPTLPRMLVSAKAFGVFRKRLETYEVTDLPAFLEWAVKAWQTTASSHERGARKRLHDTVKHTYKPMPTAPDFTTLAFRFPYFITCYRSYLRAEAAGLATSQEELLKRKVEKLERKVASVRDEARSAQQRERTLRQRVKQAAQPIAREVEQEEETAPRRPQRIVRRPSLPTPDLSVLDADLPPAWDDLPALPPRRKLR